MSKYNIIFVLGPPGSGKGTQCAKIVEKFEYVHLSAGELLRVEKNNPGSEYSQTIKNYFENGLIVPVEITCNLLERYMKNSGKNHFLIDGFPMLEHDLHGWYKHMGDKINLQFVLFLDCSLEICTERILERGAAGSGRADDNGESLNKRFSTYKKYTLPVIYHFDSLGLLKKLDASQDVDEVFKNVVECFFLSLPLY